MKTKHTTSNEKATSKPAETDESRNNRDQRKITESAIPASKPYPREGEGLTVNPQNSWIAPEPVYGMKPVKKKRSS